jgi:ABC-2 type transport system ATP-binding protein
MDEAERLCDRVAMLDAGRVVALDTPAGIVSLVNPKQHIRFRPSATFDDHLLAGLPEVDSVTRTGRTVFVEGTGNLLQAVASILAQNQIVAHELRLEQDGLDDAFIALTGHAFDNHSIGDLQ